MQFTVKQRRQLDADMQGTALPESVRRTPWRLRAVMLKRYGHLVGTPTSGTTGNQMGQCPHCGQEFDKRHLWQVLYHMQEGHAPVQDA